MSGILATAKREAASLDLKRLEYDLQKTGSGTIRGNHFNIIKVLEKHPDLVGIVGLDEFANRVMLLKQPPWEYTGASPRVWRDSDDGELLCWLQDYGIPASGSKPVAEAVQVVAERNRFDPLRDHLNGLDWDGVERLTKWLSTYAGATDSDVVRATGRAFMISAVARGLQPGCQVDHVLMLEGAQGVGKTQAARILGGEWTLEQLPDLHSADASRALAGKWIIELSELAQLRRSETEAIKSFITRREDDVRAPYGRRFEKHQRRCVFIGTTNESEYLRDSTGNRRYWPVEVGRIDLDSLRRDRDQLWAEAIAAYRAGELWYLTDKPICKKLDRIQASRVESDPWAAPIEIYLRGRTETTSRAISQFLEIPLDRRTGGHYKRLGGVMRSLGWKKGHVSKAGGERDQYWVPPDEH